MKKIFISHPFADDPIENKKKADEICKSLIKQGVLPISPLHLFGYMENDEHRENILEFCYTLISNCDELWSYGNSNGCLLEKEYAKKLNKPVVVVK